MPRIFMDHAAIFKRRLLSFSMVAMVCLLAGETRAEDQPAPLDAPCVDADWERAFDRTDGWIGGDAIYSVPLPDGDILWLFADTFIGQVEGRRRQQGLKMVNNTLARHPATTDLKAPEPNSVHFHWGPTVDHEPTAWIQPLSTGQPMGPKTWYWVADGIVAPASRDSSQLILFLWAITRTDDAVFGFRSAGNAIAIVDAPDRPIDDWQPTLVLNTHAVPQSPIDERTQPETIWGSEVIRADDGEKLWIFGYRKANKIENELVLARVSPDQVAMMDQWEFRSERGWSDHASDAVGLVKGVTTEFSLHQTELPQGPRWVLIQSQPFLGESIIARTAENITGPCSPARSIYRIPNINHEKKHFTYAAKAHPEISRPGELLITYVVNSFDFGEAATNADIYRPRFIRVPLSLVAP